MTQSSANDVVIAGYVRSPFHFARKGALTKVRPDELAGQVVRALVEKTGIKGEDVEDLLLGCAFPEGEQGLNVARVITFLAGDLPISVAGATINRFCGSSMQSIHTAAGAIKMGAGDAFICAGVESMTRVPMMGFNPLPHPGLYESFPAVYMGMGETAENVAQRYQLTRQQQEEFAVKSHQKAAASQKAGKLKDEIVPIKVDASGDTVVDADGCIRPETTTEGLADLKPAFLGDGHGYGRYVFSAHRRRFRRVGVQRRVRREKWPRAAGARAVGRRRRLRTGRHGPRPDRGDQEGAEARRYQRRRSRCDRAERGFRFAGTRLHR